MVKRKGIGANTVLLRRRRMIAVTPMLVAFAAAMPIVLANVAASVSEPLSASRLCVNEGAQIQAPLVQNNTHSTLHKSFGDLFKVKVILDRRPHSTFFLAGYGGKPIRVIIGKSAWGIVCRIDDSGRPSVEITELDTFLDTNHQIPYKRFGWSRLDKHTGRMNPAFRVELEGIQEHILTTSFRPIHISNDRGFLEQSVTHNLVRRSNAFGAGLVGQTGQGGECCVTCSGITVCGCAVEAPCGSCCVGPCCDGFNSYLYSGGEKILPIEVGKPVKVDDYELTVRLIRLEPTIVMEVTSPAIPK